jgi:hypothetical protein
MRRPIGIPVQVADLHGLDGTVELGVPPGGCAHLISGLDQTGHQMPAEKTSSAGHKDALTHMITTVAAGCQGNTSTSALVVHGNCGNTSS